MLSINNIIKERNC